MTSIDDRSREEAIERLLASPAAMALVAEGERERAERRRVLRDELQALETEELRELPPLRAAAQLGTAARVDAERALTQARVAESDAHAPLLAAQSAIEIRRRRLRNELDELTDGAIEAALATLRILEEETMSVAITSQDVLGERDWSTGRKRRVGVVTNGPDLTRRLEAIRTARADLTELAADANVDRAGLDSMIQAALSSVPPLETVR